MGAMAATDETPHNQTFIDQQGVIQVVLHGRQTVESVAEIRDRHVELANLLRRQGRKVYIVVDLRGIKHTDSATRNEAKKFIDLDLDAGAIIGNRYLQPIVSYILRMGGNSDRIHYFGSMYKARRWIDEIRAAPPGTRILASRYKRRISFSGWVLLVVTILMGFMAYGSWRQAQDRLEAQADVSFERAVDGINEAWDSRTQAYLDALIGFRSLFHASQSIEPDEYAIYFNSLDTIDRYPGILTIDNIVPVRMPSGDVKYIVHYVGVATTPQRQGSNVGKDRVRLAAFETARDSGEPTASGSVNLDDSPGSGFVVVLPVYETKVPTTIIDRRVALSSYLNALFRYSDLFRAVFTHVPTELEVTIRDGSATLYHQGTTAPNNDDIQHKTHELHFAGRTFTLAVSAPSTFGLTTNELRTPRLTASSGIIVTLLLLAIFWQQVRARRKALRLVDIITEDLQNERNSAVAIKNKDEAILSSIGDGVFVLDPSGVIMFFNKKAQEITGYTDKEVIGKLYHDVLHFNHHSKDGTEDDSFIRRALSGKAAAMSKDTVLTRKDGTTLLVADSAAPVYDADDQQQGIIVVFRDITEQAHLDQAKDEFISIISHQLRTPLTAIRLFAEMLESHQVGKLNDKQQDYAKKILISTERMTHLVGDILNISRVELGRVKITPEPTNVRELIQSHLDEISPLAAAKKVNIDFTCQPDLGKIPLDPTVFGQVVHNLTTNAIRYTRQDEGRVMISFQQLPEGDYQLSVKDNGIGIPEDAQPHIFERFFRAHNAIAAVGEGTGLGLYLVKLIVDTVGGTVRFETKPAQGTIFYVTLPSEGMHAKKGEIGLK